MKKKPRSSDDQKKLALVSITTTGLHIVKDEIIEIAVLCTQQHRIESIWHRLLKPQIGIPTQVQALSGITMHQVADAPSFADIAEELWILLQDCILVAQNVRFCYGFIRNAFGAVNRPYVSKQLCTIKLFRTLYPQLQKPSSQVLLTHLGIKQEMNTQYPALMQVQWLWQCLQVTHQLHSAEQISAAMAKNMLARSQPLYLQTDLQTVPNSPGVYLFYGEDNQYPLYIGKSKQLKSRILAHFSADCRDNKELKISQSIQTVQYIKTAGELGALLLEAHLIKKYLPLYNRRLRRTKTFFCLRVDDTHGYAALAIQAMHPTQVSQIEHSYGIYRSRHAAEKAVKVLTTKQRLCLKWMGLEKTKGPCFFYQLKRCQGACIGDESHTDYNKRVYQVLAALKVRSWPFVGVIGICEENSVSTFKQVHLIYYWGYLGTANSDEELQQLLSTPLKAQFDLDIYNILYKYLDSADPNDILSFPNINCM